MKKIIGALLALYSAFAFSATLNPVQLLNPAGSTAGQTIVSTGPSSAPAWAPVPLSGITGTLAITNGGTGATTAAAARTNLGLGTIATQNANAVAITGGSISGVTGVTGRLINVREFTSTGTYTPTTGTGSIIVEVQAPSGGSGGNAATSSGQNAASAGGGSGGYARALVTSGFSGVTVTIGAPGAAGAAGANAGGTGGTTSFGSIISCPGGTGGGGGSIATALGSSSNGATQTTACTISGATPIVTFAGTGTGPGAIYAVGGFVIASAGANSALGQGGNPSGGTACISGTGAGAGPSGLISLASSAAVAGCAGRPATVIIYEFSN